MKMLRRLLYILPVIGIMIASCVDIESKDFEHIGGYNTMDNEESAQYYADLRAWKATSQGYGRPIFFGWFSNWSPEYKRQNKLFHFQKTFCSRFTFINTKQNVHFTTKK